MGPFRFDEKLAASFVPVLLQTCPFASSVGSVVIAGQPQPSHLRLVTAVSSSKESPLALVASSDPSSLVAAMPDTGTQGLLIYNGDRIRSFLAISAESQDLSVELQEIALGLLSEEVVPYKSIRSLWLASPPSSRPSLWHIISGCSFVFSSPKPREKSEELKERLRKLEELVEKKAYEELVKDIAPKRANVESFSSYKDQLGFGLHIVVIMFTGYLVGYATFRALFGNNIAMNAAGGIFGLVFGMLLETVLFILRSSSHDAFSKSAVSSLKKN